MKTLTTLTVLGLLASPTLAWAQTPNPTVDSDGDGVDDAQDVSPCDPRVSARAFVPSGHVYAMVLFEDHWPTQGDFDFNDAVVAVHQVLELDSSARMTRLIMNIEVMAAGGTFDNGLALRLPTVANNVLSAQLFREGDATASTSVPLWPTEAEATMTLAPSLNRLFGAQGELVNAVPGAPARPYAHLTLVVELAEGALSPAQALFDLFLFDETRGVEVHLPEHGPTSRMDAALLGTGDDDPQRNFTTRSGIPFALAFFQEVSYPSEGVAIDRLFPGIVGFGASGGIQNTRFFEDPVASERYVDQYNLSPLHFAFDTDRSCFRAVPGECGVARAAGTVAPPSTANLCAVGTPSAVVDDGHRYTWSCQGLYSAATSCQTTRWACLPNESAACTPSTGAVGVRVCGGDGTQWGACQQTGCAPGYVPNGAGGCVLRICAPNQPSACTVNGGAGRRTCNVNGTGFGPCLPVTNGACGSAHGQSFGEVDIVGYVAGSCAAGRPTSPNYGGGRMTWSCLGTRGGSIASCGASFVPCASPGQQRTCAQFPNRYQACHRPGYWGWCVLY